MRNRFRCFLRLINAPRVYYRHFPPRCAPANQLLERVINLAYADAWPWKFQEKPTEGDYGSLIFFEGPTFSFISDEVELHRSASVVRDKNGEVKDPNRWDCEISFPEDSKTAAILKKYTEWVRTNLGNDEFKKSIWPKGKPPSTEALLENYKPPLWNLGNGTVSLTGKFSVGKNPAAKRKERDPASLYLVKNDAYQQMTDYSMLEEGMRGQVKISIVGLTLSGKSNFYNLVRFDGFLMNERVQHNPFEQIAEQRGLKRVRDEAEEEVGTQSEVVLTE